MRGASHTEDEVEEVRDGTTQLVDVYDMEGNVLETSSAQFEVSTLRGGLREGAFYFTSQAGVWFELFCSDTPADLFAEDEDGRWWKLLGVAVTSHTRGVAALHRVEGLDARPF